MNMMENNILSQIRDRYPELDVKDKTRFTELSEWISGSCSPLDPLEDQSEHHVVLDCPDWSAEIFEFEDCTPDNPDKLFMSIRYKHGNLRDIKVLRDHEVSLENVTGFLERPEMLELALKYESYDAKLGEPRRFDGDIVITDPCYCGSPWDDDPDLDIYTGLGFEKVFGPTYIYGPTIYGDWSCTVYGVGSEDPLKIIEGVEKTHVIPIDLPVIGEFCADAGLVCVVYREKSGHVVGGYGEHCRTVIPEFHGTVQYYVRDRTVYIIGRSDDGEHNFVSFQTGL